MNKTNEINSLIGHIEQLPDEILLDLFENYIDIPSKDIFHIKSFTHFADQIVSLHLSRFCNDLDLSKFVNLRLLHIEKPSRSQLLSIRSDFLPSLCYLSLSSCWYSLNEFPEHLTNLEELCPFQQLRFCILPNGKMVRFQAKQ